MEVADTVLGIDLGGTNIRYGIVGADGQISNFYRESVNPTMSGDQLVDWICQRVESSYDLHKIQAIGVGLAGMVLHQQVLKTGLVVLPGLGDYPFAEKLSGRLHKPCWVSNDASAALRGEFHFGAARDHRNVLLLTLGTGIGGGLLLDGRLREGTHGSSVEIGLFLLGDPSIEGGTFPIESRYSPGAIMKQLGDPNGRLFERIGQGDTHARQLENKMIYALGMLITNIHLLLDLDLVLISGGLVDAGDELVTGLRRAFQKFCPAEYQFDLQIKNGTLPVDTAGVIGAACVWFEHANLLPSLAYEA